MKWGSLQLVCGGLGSRNYKAEMQASSQLLEPERGRRETATSEQERRRDFLPHVPFFNRKDLRVSIFIHQLFIRRLQHDRQFQESGINQ